ncbi:MAG: hypothetical protein K2H53_06455 [Clostridia bacterium]|nr:hypothetical protein [Clostridia bacterium]
MRGRKEKKEKRYFCDLCKKVVNMTVLLVVIAIVIGIIALVISHIATINYIESQEKRIGLFDRYSDVAYEELKEDVRNQLEGGGRLEEIVDNYEGSYDGEKTIIKCSKTNDNGFVVKITVTISKNDKILSIENQFKTKEEYVEQTKSEMINGKYSVFLMTILLFMYFGTFALLIWLSKISKKHKERDQKKEENCEQKQQKSHEKD